MMELHVNWIDIPYTKAREQFSRLRIYSNLFALYFD
jgi:hypothetical protein